MISKYGAERPKSANTIISTEDASGTFWFFFGGDTEAARSLSPWKDFGSSDIQADGCVHRLMQTGAYWSGDLT